MSGPTPVPEGRYAGWQTWGMRNDRNFGVPIGQIWWRHLDERSTEVAIETHDGHRNGAGALHGGFLMSFADMALYAASVRSLVDVTAVTLTCNTEFLGAGLPGQPLVATMEILQETGKVIFLRGVVRQDGRAVISFSGTLRKVPRVRLAPAERQD